jgi:hypothetical protein
MLKHPMKPLFGRVVLNDIVAAGAGPAAAATCSARCSGRSPRTPGTTGASTTRLRVVEEVPAVARAGALGAVDLRELGGRQSRLAFWINVYNALVFHGIVALGIRHTVWEMRGFYRRVCYRVGGLVLSADNVEHGVLRDNARHGWLRRRRFGARDARLALPMHPMDPRIHFAITCGAQSCPPVGVYRAEALDQQLDLAARNFLNQEVTPDARGRVTCSRILRWYAKDFEGAGGLGAFMMRHLDAGPARDAVGGRARPCDVYRLYDWSLQHEPVE